MSAQPLEARLARLEGAYEQISDRLNGFDLRFARLEEKVDSGFGRLSVRMDREFSEMRRLTITGAATIAGFILISIILRFFTHVR